MTPRPTVRAWRPEVAGVAEVLHAHFPSHAYPSHTHDTWTLLIIDSGAVRFDVDRHAHGALPQLVTLLPPHVPHDGRNVTSAGFRKRVVYLEEHLLPADRIGAAVDHPGWHDPGLRSAVSALDRALADPRESFESETRLASVVGALTARLARSEALPAEDPPLARRLREMLDDRVGEQVRLTDLAADLQAHPSHLVRSFSRAYGIPPHRYLTGRRLDLARRLLLRGVPAAEVADRAGFYDQAHLTRHFRRLLATTPAAYARSGR